MAAENGDTYILGRSKNESLRLEEQHIVLISNAGYVIHPTIQSRLPSNARIADIATGTGAWALDAARNLPEGATVTGFDISSAQFPNPSPAKNVQFVLQDAKQPFPSTYHGTFDLVHVRALLGAILGEEWDSIMRNLVQLLKPGGSLQWVEGNFGSMQCLRSGPDYAPPPAAINRLLDGFYALHRDRLAVSVELLLQAAGKYLIDLEKDAYATDRVPESRGPMSRALLGGFLGVAEKFGVWPAEEFRKLEEGVYAEIERGFYVRGDMSAVMGRKP